MKTSLLGGGCLGFTSRSLSIISGAISVLCSLTMILVLIYLLIYTTAYNLVTRSLSDWFRQHIRDNEVSFAEILKSEILVFYLLLIKTVSGDGHCPLLHGAAPPPIQACPLRSDWRRQSLPSFFHPPPRSNDLQNLQTSHPPLDDIGHDCHNNPILNIWGLVLPLILCGSAGCHTFPLPRWSHSGTEDHHVEAGPEPLPRPPHHRGQSEAIPDDLCWHWWWWQGKEENVQHCWDWGIIKFIYVNLWKFV